MDITDRHPEYLANEHLWRRVRDALAGQDGVEARGTLSLPRPEGQDGRA